MDDDPELEAIRQRRMAELQQSQQNQAVVAHGAHPVQQL